MDILRARTKISVIIPVHNEETYLPYSLRSLKHCQNIDQLIFFLDRCSDRSLQLIKAFSEGRHDTEIIESQQSTWNNPIAEVFEHACQYATHDLIYTMASDVITDPHIYNPTLFESYDLVSFQYTNYTPKKHSLHEHYVNLLGYLPFTYTCRYGKWSGHFAMKRSVWETLHFHDVRSPDLDFFNRAFATGYTHKLMKSKTLHLRTGLRKEKQIEQAEQRFLSHADPLKVYAHSLLNLKLYLLAYYMKLTSSSARETLSLSRKTLSARASPPY